MSIRLESLTKLYDGNPVVADLSLEVAPDELLVLLGPSGSGKSTVLRMIAGLVPIDSGRVLLHGRDVSLLPPQKRETGFVFQHYALFRHLTVEENVAFALSVRGVARQERKRRSTELLELVGLAGLGRRLPRQLSGGQQQRVALARALAHEPKVLLLDEPFGALDARIRVELRRSLHAIQRELGLPTIFVTHDQEEAFELADRIAVLALGRLIEVGPPRELYLRPRTELVATFLGNANLLVGEATGGGVKIGPVELPLATRASEEPTTRRRLQVLFRPEDVALAAVGETLGKPALGLGTVESCSFSGPTEQLRLRLPPFVGVRAIAPPAPFGADYFLVEATRSPHESRRLPLAPGDRAQVSVRRLHALVHPGLHFLLACDGSPAALDGVGFGAELARRSHARVTLIACDVGEAQLPLAKERLGSGLAQVASRAYRRSLAGAVARESAQAPCDLVVVAAEAGAGHVEIEAVLASGDHHVLLARGPEAIPTRVLLCIAIGEPGKEDIAFTGRLVRHLGARVTLLTVLPPDPTEVQRQHAERFLEAGVRTLAPMGVPAEICVAAGDFETEVLASLGDDHDLLAVGAPLPGADGEIHLGYPLRRLLARTGRRPVLVVRGSVEGA